MDSGNFILYFGFYSNTTLFILFFKLFQLWSLGILLVVSCLVYLFDMTPAFFAFVFVFKHVVSF